MPMMMKMMMSLAMLLMSNGGGTDLLDAFPHDGYWKAKEVIVSVDQLLSDAEHPPASAEGHPKEAQIRQLMAIRTLGQQKQAKAIPLLKNLTASKDPFVAEYAQAALKAIDGQPFQRPIAVQVDSLKSDISLIPAKVDTVGQWTAGHASVATIDEIIAGLPAGAGENGFGAVDKMFLDLAERVGNARIDSISFGIRGMGERTGSATLVFHGDYDSQALSQYLKDNVKLAPREGAAAPGVEVLENSDFHVVVILAGNHRAIVMVGDDIKTFPVDEVLAAIKAGELTPLANQMGKTAPGDGDRVFWAVSKVTAAMRRDTQELKAFKTGALTVDRKDDAFHFELKGSGDDAAQVADGVKLWTSNLEESKTEIKPELAKEPFLKPIADTMDSIKFQSDGVKASLTGVFVGKPWMVMAAMYGAPEVEVQSAPAVQEIPATGP